MGLMAIAGLQSLIRRKHPEQARLSPNNALVVLASYAFCMCVHFSGGWWLLRSLL
jgi:hypothetical protein